MFRKIILGYTYSPSLGDKLLAFEKELQKKLRWQIVAIFAIIFALFSICFTSVISSSTRHPSTPIIKIESSKDLELSSKIIFPDGLSAENSQVIFQLKAKNTSNETQISNFKFQASDILEYGKIAPQKGLYLKDGFGEWNEVTIQPNETEIKQFSVKVKNKIPSLGKNPHNKNSYDCKMSLFFGNETSQSVKCSPLKVVEGIIYQTQSLSTDTSIYVFVVLIFVTAISAFRTNLLLNQIRSIKRK